MKIRVFLIMLVFVCMTGAGPRARGTKGAPLGTKGEWVKLEIKTAGQNLVSALAVDRTNGDIYILPHAGTVHSFKGSQGMWKSTDKGVTFTQVDKTAVTGGGWNSFCIDIDLEQTGRLAVFPMYGTGAMTLDAGKTWQKFGEVKPRGSDYGSVDWSDPKAQTVYCCAHEAEPGQHVSFDSGKTWAVLAKPGCVSIGVLASKTLLVSHNGLQRSTDAGKTWTGVKGTSPRSKVVRKFNGKFYFLTNGRLLVSEDEGLNWKIQGIAAPDIDAWAGPYFGKDENHILQVGPKGVYETLNAGKTWALVTTLPDTYKGKFGDRSRSFRNGPNFGYDHVNNIMYVAMLGVPCYRFERK
ncbi:hypothetical protein ACFL4W_04020 [Planctomycetota bacterium]